MKWTIGSMIDEFALKHERTSRYAFAGLALTTWASFGTLDSAWQVIVRVGTFQKINAVYPFTFGAILASVTLAYFYTRSLITSLTFPFAFIGLYEIAWHVIPGSGQFPNIHGITYILSWILVGCVSIRDWRLDKLASFAVLAEMGLFAIWFVVGFGSEYSLLLNIVTKILMALIFIEVLRAGARRNDLHQYSRSIGNS